MTEFLLQLGTMSVQATVIVCVVLLLRFIFSKLHIAKKYTNLLWLIPYIAMIIPLGIRTPVSFWQITQNSQTKIEQAINTMPYSAEHFVQTTIEAEVLQEMEENRGAPPSLENIQSESSEKIENSVNSAVEENSGNVTDYSTYHTDIGVLKTGLLSNLTTWDIFIYTVFSIWFLGMLVFLMYGIVGSLKLKKKLICSLMLSENIYVADDIKEPFVFGVISPKIYLPCNLTKDNEYYVVEHEKTHINRKDPVKKIIAFLITGIHWFNPFAYVAFHMMTKDMEMACDEETVQRIGLEKRKDYATALLKLSTKKRNLLIPVAFGEGNVKSRINNVLRYKKTLKILAVIAAITTVTVAVIFLTKPIEKTTVLGNMRNHDVVTIPKEEYPKAIIVTYKGEKITFDENYYDSFRIFLEELEVYEEELNKSRAETRPSDVVIQLEEGVAYNFDENLETIWCNNGVKPSMTYEIVEPKLVIQFLDAQIAAWKIATGEKERDDAREQIENQEENQDDMMSFLDKQPQNITAELVTEGDFCGENGPFLDYADDRYVVFHTIEWFYVYDMMKEEMIWSVGCNHIKNVEVSAAELRAYIYDSVDLKKDDIYIFKCDISNAGNQLTSIWEDFEIDDFDDFLVTSECVLYDPTVFRTKECIRTTDGRYLYLESGSGLLRDLKLILEDEKGNRTLYESFSITPYHREEKITQVLLNDYCYMETIDINHDGEEEYLFVDVTETRKDSQKPSYLMINDKDGNTIWQTEMGLPRAGWNSYFRVETKEGTYLMEYLPVVMQERGEYSYRVFYLGKDGSEIEVASDSISFLMYPNNVDIDAQAAIPKEKMVAFADEVNVYLENARALISTVDGALRYQTPAQTYTYKEVYGIALEAADIDVSESVELNITKLQNYYEKTRKDILDKNGVILPKE